MSSCREVKFKMSTLLSCRDVELSKMRIFLHHTFESENVRFPFL